jgi:hypothetical protein
MPGLPCRWWRCWRWRSSIPAGRSGCRSPSSCWCRAERGGQGSGQDVLEIGGEAAGADPRRAGSFRWVALLTGSKNAVKGAGFLLGAALLALVRGSSGRAGHGGGPGGDPARGADRHAAGPAKGAQGREIREVFSKSANVNWLSAARVFLFGARDVWFVVGIPIYFYAVLSDGTTGGQPRGLLPDRHLHGGLDHPLRRGAGLAPRLLRAASRPEGDLIAAARGWAWALAVVPAMLTGRGARWRGPHWPG